MGRGHASLGWLLLTGSCLLPAQLRTLIFVSDGLYGCLDSPSGTRIASPLAHSVGSEDSGL